MKTTFTIFIITFLVATSAISKDIVTRSGTVYHDIVVQRVEPDGITIKHSAGILKVHARDLSDEDRAEFNLTPEAARAYAMKKREEAAAQERERQEAAREWARWDRAREYTLYVFSVEEDSVKFLCTDGSGESYIMYGSYSYIPETYVTLRAYSKGRVQTSSTSSWIVLDLVERPRHKRP